MRCNNLHRTVGTDDRTCSEQSERNSETGEFIRYSGASTQNKLCLSHNRALHGHYVFYLLAMSAALDVRKCFALASIFACGLRKTNLCLSHNRALHGHCVYICLLCPLRSMSANALRLRLSSLAVSCMAGQVANKVCRQCNLHCRKSVTAV